MKLKIQYIVLLIALAGLGVNSSYGQERKIDKARKSFKNLNYVNAQKIYLKVAENGYESEELFTKLGNSYYFNAEYEQALKWYEKLFAYQPEPHSVWSYLRYSQTLKANGKKEEAKKYYDIFLKKTGRKARQKISAADYLKLIQQNSDRYEFKPLKALYNENQISYGHTVYEGALYYSTTYDQPHSFLNTKDAWTDMSFMTLFKVEIDSANQALGDPKRVRGTLKDKFHTATPAFTKDGKTVYFTRSNEEKAEDGDDRVLKIYRAVKKDEKWQTPEALNINSNRYSTAHPALNAQENKLYFASDRPGGHGQSDLYFANINKDGSLGRIENLGDQINTSGKETFPYITDKNELYFSSDGHFGLGGLDVFYVKIHKDGSYGHILNVGKPINSHADDFAFGIDSNRKYGFVSSNRDKDNDSSFVKDNIYSFKEIKPIKDVFKAEIEGYVTDADSQDAIEGAQITLLEDDLAVYKKVSTDAKGHYRVSTNKFDVYTLRAKKEGYETEEKQSEARLSHQRIDFELQSTALEPGVDLAKMLNIPLIHFDFDQYNIREDAQLELQKVYELLKEYPAVKIAIHAHTDSRGSDAYNKQLSDKRAKSTRDYLIHELGIKADRITEAKGFGESQLVNECSDGVPCSEAQHQKNRRSEFIVEEN